jgi:hypothetical protein
MSRKVLLAMFVVGAIAFGLLVVLVVGLVNVEEDGRSRDGAGLPGVDLMTGSTAAGYRTE